MSMLTPPGMGGQYRIKGDRYPRMRRPKNRRKIVFAGLATAMVLGLVGWGSLQLIDVFSGNGGTTAQAADRPGEKCRAQDGKAPGGKGGPSPSALPGPEKITVNVLNATSRTGLAAKTAKELKKRGYTVGEVANAPKQLDHKVKGTGLLIGADGDETVARLKVLGAHLDGAKTRNDERQGDDVDLVIGDEFAGLTDAKKAESAVEALAKPSPSPVPGC